MSGFVGMLALNGAPIDRVLLRQMTDRMTFRGPDRQDIWAEGSIGLGHALLRTTFESQRERGPFSLDGQVWIAADARVDQRPELIHKLRAKGQQLTDDTPDPELILHAYHVWGDACLDHLTGDFAFAIWDGRMGRLLCARDQIGMVPFYYAVANDCLTFGNTLQAIRLHPDISDELNEEAIADFLVFRSCQDLSASTFMDIKRLPPAHRLTWSRSGGTCSVQRYWSPPDGREYLHFKRPEDYVERFSELFRQAVADRLRTDRVAVAMSGGMDSPSVAAVAHSILASSGGPFQLRALTHIHTLIPHEERSYAGLVAESIGFPIEYIDVSGRFLSPPPEDPRMLSPELSSQLTWRFAPWLELRSRAADTGRVLLNGLGGDPGLYLSKSYWLDLLRAGELRQIVADMRQYSRTYGRRAPLFIRANLRRWLGAAQKEPPFPSWLDPDFVGRLQLESRRKRLIRGSRQNMGWRSIVNVPFWPNLVSSWDPGNTLVPLKVRSPFLDLRLIRYLSRVPPVPWFESKRLLRQTMRGILPGAVLQRPKALLPGNPLRALSMEQRVPDWVEQLATAPELAGYVDREVLLGIIRSPERASDWDFMRLLRPLALAYWLSHWRTVE